MRIILSSLGRLAVIDIWGIDQSKVQKGRKGLILHNIKGNR